MNYLYKSFREHCKEQFTQYGYRCRGRSCFRIKNHIFQTFSIRSFSWGRSCTVEFGVFPFSYGIDRIDLVEYELCRFESKRIDVSNANTDKWYYDNHDTKSMDACVERIIPDIQKYLIPFFDRCDSPENALQELIELERHFYEVWKETLRISHIQFDTVIAVTRRKEINYLDQKKYYFALESGDYEFAKKCRQALLEQNISAYRETYDYSSEENREYWKGRIQELQKDIELMERGKYEILLNGLKENEETSRQTLKAYLPKILDERAIIHKQ